MRTSKSGTRLTLPFVAVATLVTVLGCRVEGDGPDRDRERAAKAGAADAAPKAFAVAHQNRALATPSFVWLSRSDWPTFGDAAEAARAVAVAVAPTFHLRADGVESLGPAVVRDTGRGPVLARFTQRVDGIDVFRGGMNVALSRRFEPVAASGLLARDLRRTEEGFTRSPLDALAIAYRAMTRSEASFTTLDTAHGYERFTSSAAGKAALDQPARTRRVYFPSASGLVPAYYVELMLAGGAARSYVVSASHGKILFTNDLVRHDAYSYRVWADPVTKLPMDGPQGNASVPLVDPTPSGFTPAYVEQALVTLESFPFSKADPWLPAGATTTLGNNVRAYSDVVRPNGLTADTKDTAASTTSAATFDHVYDVATVSAGTTPAAVKAAVTQMFYTTNFLHDWFYDAGFDEEAGNHQRDNLGRGGRGNDPLLAETQDYSGRNNANAATPADGASPRIQMYLFGGQTEANLQVNGGAIAGKKSVGTAGQFGQDSFAVTGTVVLANDADGVDVADACEDLVNASALAGHIALVHRGNCSFVAKAQKVQAAGALGLIVGNVAASNQATFPPFMGGTAADVEIPALSLALGDAQALEAAIATGVSVTMNRLPSQDLDGALDDAIVSHEWGHVLSNRLVADGSGLDTNQAGGLGEGWGDFVALMLAVRPEDATVPTNVGWSGVYPSASFASSRNNDFYYGIRRVPYSTDLKKDPLTFKHIADGVPLPSDVAVSFGEEGSSNSEVHNTGEVWATMLWECYAALLRDRGIPFAEAQDRMKRYLVASLQLTPPSPTLLEARDAVLAAAYASDPLDFDLFWKAFAKRGAGVGAVGPAKDSPDNRGVVESYDVGGAVALVSATVVDDVISCDHDGILDEGEIGTVEVTVRNSGATTLAAAVATLSSKNAKVGFDGGGSVKLDALKPFETKSTKVRAFVEGPREDAPIVIDVKVEDPSLPAARVLQVEVPARHALDEVEASSATDGVETKGTSWEVTGDDATGTSAPWKRERRAGNTVWFIPNPGEPADHRLTSAPFDVAGASFGLTFRHRWSFESSQRQQKDFDGGVIEISIDGGKTWKDASELGTVPYNVTLDDDDRTTQPLKGRRAFGAESPGYPDQWVTTTARFTLPSENARAQIRFRVGADDNTGADGWEIDDVALTDVSSKPFWSFVPQRDLCDPNGPTVSAGPGKAASPKARVTLEGSGTHPKGLPITFQWRQVAGPPVTLLGKDTSALAFDAPDATGPVVLTFALRGHDGALLSAPSTVDVAVGPVGAPPGPSESGGCGCRTVPRSGGDAGTGGALAAGALAAVAAVLRRRRDRSGR